MKVKVKVSELFATSLQAQLLKFGRDSKWNESIELEAEPVDSEPEWIKSLMKQADSAGEIFNGDIDDVKDFIRKEIIEKICEEIKERLYKNVCENMDDCIQAIKSKWLKGKK